MSATDHTKHYSATDIQRYLAGELSPADMHALELAALDDPFLADAIEGMQQSLVQKSQVPIDTQLEDLRQQLQKRVAGDDRRQAAPVIAFRWWQAAAAAAVIIIGGIWFFNNTSNSPTNANQIAAVEANKNIKPEAAASRTVVADSLVVTNHVVTDSQPARAKTVGGTAYSIEGNNGLTSKSENKGLITQYNNNSKDVNPTLQKTYRPLPTPAPANTEAKILTEERELVSAEKTHHSAAARNTLTDQYANSDSNRIALALKKNQSNRNPVNLSNTVISSNATRQGDFEQIVVSKTPRDTSAVGYLSKPREREMNLSRKELSARQAKKNPDALLSGFVSGRVTDNATNSPISNAMVRIDGKRDYFTDNKGWFKIPTTDSVVNVAVGLSGYYTQNLQLNNNTSNLITLNQLGDKAPNPNLNFNNLQGRLAGVEAGRQFAGDTVVVTASKPTVNYNTSLDSATYYRTNWTSNKKQDTQEAHAYSFKNRVDLERKQKSNLKMADTEPEYGWVKYQQYLDQHKRLPENGTAGAGKVVVAFEVDKKGLPANFTIISSPGQAYADEAIRLIKAGPSWKLLKGRKAKATVVVTF